MDQINVIYKGPLRGECSPPPDKSISHRAIMFSSLAEGQSRILNFLQAEDPVRTINAFRQMNIDIALRSRSDHGSQTSEVIINGRGLMGLKPPEGVIDCGNSGTTMRLLSGVLAGQPFSSTLSGDIYLLKRPMQRVITPLTEMGAHIHSERDGLPPLTIQGGNLKSISYNSPVASAQVKSAVLLAGLYCSGITSVTEPDKSRDHTERMLKASGVEVSETGLKVSVKGIARLNPLDIAVPGDFSSAAFFMVAGLLLPGSEILIKNVGINETRTGLLHVLQDMMEREFELLNVRDVSGEPVADILVKHARLKGVNVGADMIVRAIDEFPILCVAAARAEGATKITGAKELRVKESDRIASMASELRKMGVEVEELEDGIIIEGRDDLKPSSVDSHGDHRIAMSLAIAGLTCRGETVISDTECVDTSFPAFTDTLDRLSG